MCDLSHKFKDCGKRQEGRLLLPLIQNCLKPTGRYIVEFEQLHGDRHGVTTKATSEIAPVNAPANAPVKLNKTQFAIVKAIINDDQVTYDDLKTIVGVDRSTITRNIAVLKEKGVIRRVGEDKNGYWEVLISIEDCNK